MALNLGGGNDVGKAHIDIEDDGYVGIREFGLTADADALHRRLQVDGLTANAVWVKFNPIQFDRLPANILDERRNVMNRVFSRGLQVNITRGPAQRILPNLKQQAAL